MGCPAPHITQQMAGGALLQEENLTRNILRTLVEAVDIPVTLKIALPTTGNQDDNLGRIFFTINFRISGV